MNKRWDKSIGLAKRDSSQVAVEIAGLDISLWAADPGFLEWALMYLGPPLERSCKALSPSYTVGCIHSDNVVSEILEEIKGEYSIKSGFDRQPLLYRRLSEHRDVCVDAHGGVASIVDRDEHSVTIVVSTRTKWPALEYSRAVREVFVRHLEGEGWVQYHAGCVNFGDKTILICLEHESHA